MTFTPPDPSQGPPPPGAQPPSGPQQPVGQQQYAWQGQQYRPQAQAPARQPKPSPFAAFGVADWLVAGTVGAAVLGWLLSLFADVPVSVDYSLAAGLLGALALAPAKTAMPRVLPFVAVVATLAGLLAIRSVVYVGVGGALGAIVFVLVLLEMFAAAGALLVDRGVVSVPRPQPKPPRAPAPPSYQPQQSWGAQQGHPGQPGQQAQPGQQGQPGQPQGGRQPQAGPAQSGQGEFGGWQPRSQEQHITGNFDPNQFDAETQRGQPEQPGHGQSAGEGTPLQQAPQQGTKQFAPPKDI